MVTTYDLSVLSSIRTIFGVDFSGAARCGEQIWIARARMPTARRGTRLVVDDLSSMSTLAGCDGRAEVLARLVDLISASTAAAWGIDFPFGLPIELIDMGDGWPQQLQFIEAFDGDAKLFGHWCVDHARRIGDKMHIRRATDSETKTPFDCYHYRIIYQTFHGMRDVLRRLIEQIDTAVLPFQYDRFASAKRVVVEACPSSTLKRLGLPHQNYKQPAGGPLTPRRRRTRLAILAGLEPLAEISPDDRRAIMRNPGGDALDAVIAAVGTWQSLTAADHAAIHRHPRYRREGFVFA